MCAEFVCYLFLVSIPIGTGHEQHSAAVESRDECVRLLEFWTDKWAAEEFDVEKFGKPMVACLRTVNI